MCNQNAISWVHLVYVEIYDNFISHTLCFHLCYVGIVSITLESV